MIVCKFPGCTRPKRAHGLCEGHYRQAHRGAELRPLVTSRTRAWTLEQAADAFGKATTAEELAEARRVLYRAARAYVIRSLLVEACDPVLPVKSEAA